jgi:hypothetical protein
MESGSWILIIVAVVILIMFTLFRRRSEPGRFPDVVQNIIYDVRLNQVLVNTFKERVKPVKFEINNWLLNKNKIGFLGESLKTKLNEAFSLAEEFNQQIMISKKEKSDSYKNIDLRHLKELLDECRKELEDWMITNTGQKEIPPKYPGISRLFFGDR